MLDKQGKGAIDRHPVIGADCDCESCLDEELGRVQREVRSMIGPKQRGQQPVQGQKVDDDDGSGRAPAALGGGVDVGGKRWGYVYVRNRNRNTRNGGVAQDEEEFEDDDLESSLVMVTGGGGFPEMATCPATTEKSATTVEGQLSALLTSSSKEVLAAAAVDGTKGVGAKRHTNLIENQLLTLEDQFWMRSSSRTREGHQQQAKDTVCIKGLGSAVQAVVLETTTEDSALLGDHTQQATMSDSTPVKKAVKVVTVSGGGGTSAVLEEDAGGGGGPRMGLVASPSTNLGRMKRFEQFLKSLVGKKPSSPTNADGLSRDAHADTAGTAAFERPALKVRSSVELKSAGSHKALANDEDEGPEELPPLHRHSFGSMSSLNSAVQQKFLNILPTSSSLAAAKRNLSVNNLSIIPERRSQAMGLGEGQCRGAPSCCRNGATAQERRHTRGLKTVSCSFSNFEHFNDVTERSHNHPTATAMVAGEQRRDEVGEGEGSAEGCGRRDSLHSWRLKVSKSTNHLLSMSASGGGPVRPLNRFRNSLLESVSQVNLVQQAQCSRCSSILSLAAGTMVKVRCSDSSGESSSEGVVVDASKAVHALSNGGASLVAGGQDVIVVTKREPENTVQSCKLCLGEVSPQQLTEISQCRCAFCTDVSN